MDQYVTIDIYDAFSVLTSQVCYYDADGESDGSRRMFRSVLSDITRYTTLPEYKNNASLDRDDIDMICALGSAMILEEHPELIYLAWRLRQVDGIKAKEHKIEGWVDNGIVPRTIQVTRVAWPENRRIWPNERAFFRSLVMLPSVVHKVPFRDHHALEVYTDLDVITWPAIEKHFEMFATVSQLLATKENDDDT